MGNEMGNNNTSGLQEEDNTKIEEQGKSIEEAAPGIGEKAENHVVPVAKDKDYHEKGEELAPDDPNIANDSGTMDGSEHEETEIHPSAESPKADTESIEGGGDDTGVQSDSSSNEMEPQKKPTDSNSEENLFETEHTMLEKQVSVKKEEKEVSNSTAVTVSTSHDQEPRDSAEPKSDGSEFTIVDTDQSLLGSAYSPGGVKDLQESSVYNEENASPREGCETNTVNSLDAIVVSEMEESKKDEFLVKDMIPQEYKIPNEEEFQVESGENGLGTDTSDFASGVGERYDGDATSEVNCSGEGFPSEDKYMVSEETELKRKQSENQDSQQDPISAQCVEDSVGEAEIEEANASPIDPSIEPNCVSDEKNTFPVSVSHDPESTENFGAEANIGELCHSIEYLNDNQTEAVQESCKESKGETKMVHKFGINGEESNGCKRKEEEPSEKQMVGEMMERTEDSCSTRKGAEVRENEQEMFQSLPVEEHKPNVPASLSQTLDQQVAATESKNDKKSTQPRLQFKPESENLNDFFLTTVTTFPATNKKVEALTSPVELEANKLPREASHYAISAPEMVTETSPLASASQGTEQCQQVETTSVIALISPVEFEVNKFPPEDSDYATAAPEMVIQTKAHEEVETTFVTDTSGTDERMKSLSTESIPQDLNIHPKTRKCSSFDFGLRIKPRSEESDQTPLLYQDKTTIRSSFSHQVDVSNQNPLLGDQYSQSQAAFQREAVPVEEKVISLERSDTEKSRTPFLTSSVKEEAKVNNHSTPAVVDSSLPKSKEKHKRRASLFSNCICCATVIN